jgi:hypothetical protein
LCRLIGLSVVDRSIDSESQCDSLAGGLHPVISPLMSHSPLSVCGRALLAVETTAPQHAPAPSVAEPTTVVTTCTQWTAQSAASAATVGTDGTAAAADSTTAAPSAPVAVDASGSPSSQESQLTGSDPSPESPKTRDDNDFDRFLRLPMTWPHDDTCQAGLLPGGPIEPGSSADFHGKAAAPMKSRRGDRSADSSGGRLRSFFVLSIVLGWIWLALVVPIHGVYTCPASSHGRAPVQLVTYEGQLQCADCATDRTVYQWCGNGYGCAGAWGTCAHGNTQCCTSASSSNCDIRQLPVCFSPPQVEQWVRPLCVQPEVNATQGPWWQCILDCPPIRGSYFRDSCLCSANSTIANATCILSVPLGFVMSTPDYWTATINPCPASWYCNSTTDTPIRCPAGTSCPWFSISPEPCPPGSLCLNPAWTMLCPAGSFCPSAQEEHSALLGHSRLHFH